MAPSCDLFCRVIDNLGDAGVCWRLAKQLAGEFQWKVRLWIDDLQPLAKLRPGLALTTWHQHVDGVEVCLWRSAFPRIDIPDIVIEAFACDLPGNYVSAMAARHRMPVWINLEYLSAEPWVLDFHGRPSPHPSLPLTKYFFFPGFVSGTGGVIRETGLLAPPARKLGEALQVSLFCYDNPGLPRLLDVWAMGTEKILCRVADGLARQQVEHWLGTGFPTGTHSRRGNLELEASSFLPQSSFDDWLAEHDLNFVRGEDSFVRAQWTERPFVWQAYPQDAGVHLDKVEAFLALYLNDQDDQTREAAANFWQAWNGRGDVADSWEAFRGVLPRLTFHAHLWAERLKKNGNLAENLVRFCTERL